MTAKPYPIHRKCVDCGSQCSKASYRCTDCALAERKAFEQMVCRKRGPYKPRRKLPPVQTFAFEPVARALCTICGSRRNVSAAGMCAHCTITPTAATEHESVSVLDPAGWVNRAGIQVYVGEVAS